MGLAEGKLFFIVSYLIALEKISGRFDTNVIDSQYELENFEEVLEFDNECYDVMAINDLAMLTLICSIKILVSMTPRRAQYTRYW